ncbi:serine/threonine-protein kinase [Roseateles oligotrophus]|uniref:Protein kinase n=1 Tax=Roseateles oligotrophus TaxID=1769250 RepID=A0ABT2YCQ2_9BURK|nr:serine/threonine-protein kinase [Roseateles oligotrophus]MCV2367815.1 protein kinase [Roseateles oligotrophus]
MSTRLALMSTERQNRPLHPPLQQPSGTAADEATQPFAAAHGFTTGKPAEAVEQTWAAESESASTMPPSADTSVPAGGAKTGQPALRKGMRLGAWALLQRIGRGGMGEVWLARRADGLYEAQAAIKLLRGDLDGQGVTARFARERALLARLNHSAIARLLDAGLADGSPDGLAPGQAYLVLEHVSGRQLNEHVREHGLGVAARVRLLIGIAEAVAYAHAQLIVHRDLKPSNVLVTPSGEPKLLDFGIAGLLDEGEPLETDLTRQSGLGMTLGYAAPEQVLGEPVGTEADVFSLGVMLFELLSGTLPFAPRGSYRPAAEHAILHDEPLRLAQAVQRAAAYPDPMSPGRPVDAERAYGDLEAVAAKALRKRPEERYGSVRELISDLQRWLGHRPVSVRRDDWRHRTQLLLRRHGLLAGAAALVLLSLSAGLAGATWQWQRAERAARQSDHVTRYLTDLLSSATPEAHGGNWPTVLQLLDDSRAELDQKFGQDPDTRLRLLQVLTNTYNALNRFDQAEPLAEQWVALADAQLGPGAPESLLARLGQAQGLQIKGSATRAVAVAEPLLQPLRQAFGTRSEQYRLLLQVLAASYMHSDRLRESEAMLNESWALTQAMHPGDTLERADYLNNLNGLRSRQGRHREALAALRETQDFWASREPKHAMQILVLRRNYLSAQLRLAEFEQVEARSHELVRDMDRLLGPGNDLAALQFSMLASYFTQTGQDARAAETYAALFEKAQAEGKLKPESLQEARAEALLARSRANPAAAWRPELEAQLKALSDDAKKPEDEQKTALQTLAEVALAHNDLPLAEACLRPLGRAEQPNSKQLQLEGQMARLRGDLGASRELLGRRVANFEKASETRLTKTWSAHLDLAYTQLLQGDVDAARQSLDLAAQRRPAGLPAKHRLDGVAAQLRQGLAQPRAADSPISASFGAAFL